MLSEGWWWALAAAAVVVAAGCVGFWLFVQVAGGLVAVVLAIQMAAWAWGRSRLGESAPPLVSASWTRAGVVVACVALITGAAAVNSGLNLLYFMFGAMIGCLVVSGLLSSRAIRGLTLERHVHGRAFAARPFEVVVTVRSVKRFMPSIAVMVRESLRDRAGLASREALVPVVAPKQRRDAVLTFTLPRRGRYEFGPHCVASRFPFGFFVKSLTWGRAQELVVYPAIGQAKMDALGAGSEPQWALQRRTGARFGAEEFHGLREYRPGDNPKWIHWKTTARLAKTMVREMESRDSIHLSILLDTYVPDGSRSAAERLEVAVSFAATLACEHARANRRLALVAFGPELTVVRPAGSNSPLDDMMRALALVEPVDRPVQGSLIAEARSRKLLGGRTLIVSPGAKGAGGAGRALLRDLGDGLMLVDVSHPHVGSLFEPPASGLAVE